jgi:hypothetical protein
MEVKKRKKIKKYTRYKNVSEVLKDRPEMLIALANIFFPRKD